MKKHIGFIIVLIGIFVDQISKIIVFANNVNVEIIPNLLSFSLTRNTGAAFGFAQGSNTVLAFLSFMICLALLGIIIYERLRGEKVSFALYLVLAGGFGNLLDRLFRGFVVDFIATPFIATFNIADSFIVIGSIWVIIEETLKSVFKKEAK